MASNGGFHWLSCDLCSGFVHLRALIYKGKRLFINEANLNDTESALLSHEMQKKRVCFHFNREWRSSLVRVFC